MIVAGSRRPHRLVTRAGDDRTSRPLLFTGQRGFHDRFEHMRDRRRGEAVIVMPPLAMPGEQSGRGQPRKMPARGLRRDAGGARQLGGGQRSPVHQRHQHRGAAGIADKSGGFGKSGGREHRKAPRFAANKPHPSGSGSGLLRPWPNCRGQLLVGRLGKVAPWRRGYAHPPGAAHLQRHFLELPRVLLERVGHIGQRGGGHRIVGPRCEIAQLIRAVSPILCPVEWVRHAPETGRQSGMFPARATCEHPGDVRDFLHP